jgi:hypothetical protein
MHQRPSKNEDNELGPGVDGMTPPFKAPQADAPVQYAVLAEIPATSPADAHSAKSEPLATSHSSLVTTSTSTSLCL